VTSQQLALQSPQDLFAYELSVMHAFEQHNVRTLEQLLQETHDEVARRPIRHHLEETREQVRLLEEGFRLLGQPPQAVDVQAAEGMSRDHETFRQLRPAPEVLAMHNVAAAAKIEHLEVAAYRGLLGKAILMGQPELAQLLKHILQQEEFAVAALESAGWQLGQRAAGMVATAG
jgi:ferritin-like metal-binding protein YciE